MTNLWSTSVLLGYPHTFGGCSKHHEHLCNQHHYTQAYQRRLVTVIDYVNKRHEAFLKINANWWTILSKIYVTSANAVYNKALPANDEHPMCLQIHKALL
ncbi:TPA: hypothetical protein ACH3X3_012637 [Trebouxia sp. C0006]